VFFINKIRQQAVDPSGGRKMNRPYIVAGSFTRVFALPKFRFLLCHSKCKSMHQDLETILQYCFCKILAESEVTCFALLVNF
jgi:hypothetical protein